MLQSYAGIFKYIQETINHRDTEAQRYMFFKTTLLFFSLCLGASVVY